MKPFHEWVAGQSGKYEDGSEVKPFAVRESRTPLQIRYEFAMIECGAPVYSSSVVAWLSCFCGRKSTEEILGAVENDKWFDAVDNIEYWGELRNKILSGWQPDDLPEDEDD